MKIALKTPHQLARETLRERLLARAAHYDRLYPKVGISSLYRWTEPFRVVAQSHGGSGVIDLGVDHISLEIELPFFAALYRAKIEDFLRREMELLTRKEQSAA